MTDTAELERLDGILRDPLNGLTWENRIKSADAVAEVIALRAEVDGYMEWAKDVKRLTRQLDIEMHGDGAAQQASLCDLIGAGKDMRDRAEKAEARATAAEDEVERLTAAHDTVCGALAEAIDSLCGSLADAVKRATAAEADAERLAEALHNAHAGGLPDVIRMSVIDALAAHTQRVNAKEVK